MTDKIGIRFYKDVHSFIEHIASLKDICDDGTQVVEIQTPEGWKCPRENCKMDYLHTHGVYSTLK